jgi:hypothetical protein
MCVVQEKHTRVRAAMTHTEVDLISVCARTFVCGSRNVCARAVVKTKRNLYANLCVCGGTAVSCVRTRGRSQPVLGTASPPDEQARARTPTRTLRARPAYPHSAKKYARSRPYRCSIVVLVCLSLGVNHMCV